MPQDMTQISTPGFSLRASLLMGLFLLLSSTNAITDLVRYRRALNKTDAYFLFDQYAPDGNSRLSQYFGAAYDMFEGNPKGETVDPGFLPKNVFRLTYNTAKKTADDMFFIPDQVTAIGDLSCTYSSNTATYTSMSSYQQDMSASVRVKASYRSAFVSAAFSMSAEYKSMKNSIENEEKVAIVVEAKCALYHSSLIQGSPLSVDFLAAVERAWAARNFEEFLERWGTHYAREVDFGAEAIQRTFYTRKDMQDMESMDINVAASVSAKGFGNSFKASIKTSLSQEQESKFSSTSKETRESYIGMAPTESGDAREWLSNIRRSDPVPISFALASIADLFTVEFFGNRTYSTADLTSMRNLYMTAIQMKSTQNNMVEPSPDIISFQTSVTSSALVGRSPTIDQFYFKDPLMTNPNLRTKSIAIRSGDAIDSIRITLTDGVNDYQLPQRGGNGGGYYLLNIPPRITIDSVDVWGEHYIIHGMKFYFSDGTQSSQYGHPSRGVLTQIDVKGYIIGMEGYADHILRGVRFFKRNTNYMVFNGFSLKKTEEVGFPQGIKFEDPDRPLPDFKTRRMVVYTREGNIEGIQVLLVLRSDTDLNVTSDLRGLAEGTMNTFDVPTGRFIKSACIWSSEGYIKGFRLQLDDNRVSAVMGLQTGTASNFTINGHITGVFGYNTRFLRSLGLKYINEI